MCSDGSCGTGGEVTVSEILPEPDRAWASVTESGSVLAPVVVTAGTMKVKVKTLLPATASPLVPSSKNCCVAEPPIIDRSPVTASPVLFGTRPGLTVPVRTTEAPCATAEGFAAPVTVGLDGACTVSEMFAEPMRACASAIVAGIVLRPPVVPPATVA